MIADGTIKNVDIASDAAIAKTKLALTGAIKDVDIASDAAIAKTKIAMVADPDAHASRHASGGADALPAGAISDTMLASGVGLADGNIAKLPTATENQLLVRGPTAWQTADPNFNLTNIAGTALTGRNWSADFAKLDLNLSDVRKGLLSWLESVGTRKLMTGTATADGTTFYTVPTGKILYLILITAHNDSNYGGGINLKDAGGAFVFRACHPATANQTVSLSPALPIPLPAGYSISFNLGGGTERMNLFGYEVST
jgi:hypothetical protein